MGKRAHSRGIGFYGALAAAVAALVLGITVAVVRDSGSAQATAGSPTSTLHITTRLADIRGLCIKSGTGAPASLWLDAETGLCPVYSATNRWWGPATLRQAFGDHAVEGLGGTPGPTTTTTVTPPPATTTVVTTPPVTTPPVTTESSPPSASVTAGAFCSPAGAPGKTSVGTPMTCKTSATDTQLRWRS